MTNRSVVARARDGDRECWQRGITKTHLRWRNSSVSWLWWGGYMNFCRTTQEKSQFYWMLIIKKIIRASALPAFCHQVLFSSLLLHSIAEKSDPCRFLVPPPQYLAYSLSRCNCPPKELKILILLPTRNSSIIPAHSALPCLDSYNSSCVLLLGTYSNT